MFAAAYILHALSGTVRPAQNAASEPFVEKPIAIGVLLYAAVGVWRLFKGGTSSNTMRWIQSTRHMGSIGYSTIIFCGITVFSAMLMIFYKPTSRWRQ